MKLLNDINVVASKEFIELMALKTEADGMTAENHIRIATNQTPCYSIVDFRCIALKMRALKPKEVKDERIPEAI